MGKGYEPLITTHGFGIPVGVTSSPSEMYNANTPIVPEEIKEMTKKEFIRSKRREMRQMREANAALRINSRLYEKPRWSHYCDLIDYALNKMDELTKTWA